MEMYDVGKEMHLKRSDCEEKERKEEQKFKEEKGNGERQKK